MNPETQPEFGVQLPEDKVEDFDPTQEREVAMHASFCFNKIKEAQERGKQDELKAAVNQARAFVSYVKENANTRELIEVLVALLDQAETAIPLDPTSDDVEALKDLRDSLDQHYREAA